MNGNMNINNATININNGMNIDNLMKGHKDLRLTGIINRPWSITIKY